MDKFKYLGVMVSAEKGMVEEVAHRLLDGRKALGMIGKLRKENISREVKRKEVVTLTCVYCCKMLSLSTREK